MSHMQLTKLFDPPNFKLLLKKVCVYIYVYIYDSVTEKSFYAHTHTCIYNHIH